MTMSRLRRAILVGAAVAATLVSVQPASAIIVYDPTNYAQNVLQAARALEQINNQIKSLTNQATSLINQARNLANLPLSTLGELQGQVRQTQALLGEAKRVAYDVARIDEAYRTQYRAIDSSTSDKALIEGAQARWENSVASFEDALKVQAGAVGNIDGARIAMDRLVTASQSATGALQAAQAGNQLLALQSQQLADLTALLAAQGRVQSFEAAQRAAAQAQGREQLRRFLAPGEGYRPSDVRMFHD